MDAVTDRRWMSVAVRLGHRALGATAENPPVGCVIVKEGRLVGLGCTAQGGRPHAEAVALAMAGAQAESATVYVTLEPCAHHGRTPPCADALLHARVARVVIGCGDVDPRVAGRGVARLRAAGIAVELGILGAEVEPDLAGFFSRIIRQRPHVILKLAISQDGKMARMGQRTAITGPEVKSRVHLMRAQADAILVGRRTVEIDDPELTCRLPGLESRSPIRVILSEEGTLPAGSRLLETAAITPVWLVAGRKLHGYQAVEQIICEITANGINLPGALRELAQRGINRLLVEGGAEVAKAFLAAGLVDEWQLFRSPTALGEAAVAAPLDVLSSFKPVATEVLGADSLTVYHPR